MVLMKHKGEPVCVCACVCACVLACVRACVLACVRACVCVSYVFLRTIRARCTLNKENLDLFNEESVSGACSGSASL